MNLENKIEAVLLYKNEPVSFVVLSKLLNVSLVEIKTSIENLQNFYGDRGITIVSDGEKISFGTSALTSPIIETIQKEELSRDLGRAGLETLSIILYKGPISRREIDYIRGVNSSFIIRNLLIRGLVERSENEAGERSFSYKPTLELLRYLGINKIEDLPEYSSALEKIENFKKSTEAETNENEPQQ